MSAKICYCSVILVVDASPLTFGIYSGDVDQNGFVDGNDVLDVFNDASNFTTGYVNTDVTGDGITELADILLTFNNSSAFIEVKKP